MEKVNNMKAIGIIRRIDDLGRVVIPKEIRRTLRIREGDPLEIIVNEDMVCYRKYDTVADVKTLMSELIAQIQDSDLNGKRLDEILKHVRYVDECIKRFEKENSEEQS